jgi:hypothetical protein
MAEEQGAILLPARAAPVRTLRVSPGLFSRMGISQDPNLNGQNT